MIRLYLGLIFLSSFFHGLLFVPFINFLYRLKFIQRRAKAKKETKSLISYLHRHKPKRPIGGGILIVALTSFLFLLAAFFLIGQITHQSIYYFLDEIHVILLTFIGFGLLGLYDDWVKIFGKPLKGRLGIFFGISTQTKFIWQWVLGFLIGAFLYFNLGLNFIYVPILGATFHLGLWFIPLAALTLVSFSNAFNFTDGLDGLSVGLLLIALIAFMIISFSVLDMPILLFLAIWLGGIVIFLYFNIYPGRILLGDTGSLAFGATLGLIGLLTGKLIALIVIGGLFVVELLSSAIQIVAIRVFHRRVLPLAPFHHTLELIGWPEPKIVMRAWLAGVVLALLGLFLAAG